MKFKRTAAGPDEQTADESTRTRKVDCAPTRKLILSTSTLSGRSSLQLELELPTSEPLRDSSIDWPLEPDPLKQRWLIKFGPADTRHGSCSSTQQRSRQRLLCVCDAVLSLFYEVFHFSRLEIGACSVNGTVLSLC